jgi:hypothetical protein
LQSAHAAHSMLAKDTGELVLCKGHMSEWSFLFLQEQWGVSSLS